MAKTQGPREDAPHLETCVRRNYTRDFPPLFWGLSLFFDPDLVNRLLEYYRGAYDHRRASTSTRKVRAKLLGFVAAHTGEQRLIVS